MELIIDRLSALAHQDRMALFRLLVRRCPDYVSAGEIAQVLTLKPSTTSAHLATLSRAGLIRQKRVGTSLRYQLDSEGAQGLVDGLLNDCCRGRPDLCASAPTGSVATGEKRNVLFVCTGNSARSIFAEALLRAEASDRFNVYSAGTNPRAKPHPFVLDMLRRKGLEVDHLRSKDTAEFQTENAPSMDFVFTVCDRAANEECPAWPGQPISGHWGLPDPALATGTDAEKRLAFQQTFGALRNRIKAFAALPFETLDRIALQHHIDTLAQKDD